MEKNGKQIMPNVELQPPPEEVSTAITPMSEAEPDTAQLLAQEDSSAQLSPQEEQCTIGPQRQSFWKIVVFNSFQLGNTMGGWFSNSILFPIQVIEYIGDEQKTNLLALLGLLISILSVPVGPISGYISDHLVTRIGRRLPFLLLAACCNIVPLCIRAFLPCSTTLLFILNVLLTVVGKIGFSMTNAIFVATIPDIFHETQLGAVGGVNSFLILIGAAMGLSLLGYLFSIVGRAILCYICVAIVIVNVLVHAGLFFEGAESRTSPGKWVQWNHKKSKIDDEEPRFRKIIKTLTHFCIPLRYKDYTLILFSQLVFTLGFENITTFAIYYLKDKVGSVYRVIIWDNIATTAEQALAILMVNILVSGLISSLAIGFLGDRFSRKWLMFVAGISELVGCSVLVFVTNYNVILLCGIALGFGIGGMNATYVGLALNIVQDKTPGQVAQNMAILSALTGVLPKLMSNAVGGAAIAAGNAIWKKGVVQVPQLGYNFLFGISAILMTIGNILVLFVSSKYGKKKKQQPDCHEQEMKEVQQQQL